MLSGKPQQREAELPRGKRLQTSAASVPFKPPTAACWDMEHQRRRVSPVRIFNFPSPPFDVLFPLPPKFNPQERPLPLSSPIAPPFPCQSHCKPQSNKPGGWREMQNSVRIQSLNIIKPLPYPTTATTSRHYSQLQVSEMLPLLLYPLHSQYSIPTSLQCCFKIWLLTLPEPHPSSPRAGQWVLWWCHLLWSGCSTKDSAAPQQLLFCTAACTGSASGVLRLLDGHVSPSYYGCL